MSRLPSLLAVLVIGLAGATVLSGCAGEDVEQAATFLSDNFPEDADFEAALENGDLSQEDAEEFAASAETIQAYGDENCGS